MKHIIILSLFYLLFPLCLSLDEASDDFEDIDKIPITRNKQNPNFFEIEILLNKRQYTLPLDLTENQLLITTDNIYSIQSHFYSLIQQKGLELSNIKQVDDYSIQNCKNCSKKLTYLLGIEYSSYNYLSWFPLARVTSPENDSNSYRPFHSGFSIQLLNDTYGFLNIGDHRHLKYSLGFSHRTFYCPLVKDTKYWGCTIKGIVSGDIQQYVDTVDGMEVIDINDSMNPFNVNETFYFDITQRFFLVPFTFFLFVKNTSMKPFINSQQCRVSVDNDGVHMFICDKKTKRKLPDLNLVVLHWLIIFGGSELVEDIPNSNEVIYKIISHRMKNKWVMGQFFFLKYSAMFEEHNQNLEIFSYDNYVKAIAVYSYKNSKLTLDEYDLTDNLIKDHRALLNTILCFICLIGLSLLIYVKVMMVKIRKQ